jgi:peptidoglycan/xylan/chitin deacetylase (PgdA/CDA1 family)
VTVLKDNREKKAKPKRSKKFLVIIILALILTAFAAGYAVTASGFGEKAVEAFKLWMGGERQTVTPPDDQDPPGPGEDPGKPGEDPGEPGENPVEPGVDPGNGDDPAEPVIYIGQVLTIPAAEGGGSTAAQVIQSGILTSPKKQIALTFDSGWLYEQTLPLLNVLDQYKVTATFFPRALWVKDNPDLAKEIVKRGHTMGNHSLTHPHMREMTAQQMRHEMQESTRIIQETTGVRPFMFRPPYGEYNQLLLEVLAETGYPYSIMWTVDTLDWAAGTTRSVGGSQVYIDTDFIVNRVLNNASDKGIILMHIGGASTVQALPRIIEGLRTMGYQLVTVDEMLPAPGTGIVTHTVKSGETLYSIAQRYGVSVQQIVEQNKL